MESISSFETLEDDLEDLKTRSAKYMIRDLVDDHDKTRLQRNLIGMIVLYDGAAPRLVACGPPKYHGVICINEVCVDTEHVMHLTRVSAITLRDHQLAELKETGTLSINGIRGTIIIKLLEDPHAE